MTVRVIPITSILIGDNRQRQLFPEQEMQELGGSIEDKGLFAPILVRPKGDDQFTLVAGERRLRVISSFDKPYHFGNQVIQPGEVPALVRYFKDDIDAEEAELHENTVRLGLTWQEKANAVARLHEFYKRKNPSHRVGETALLVEEDDGKDRVRAKSKTYEDVQAAIFVSGYMQDPEVQKARTLKDATKIASRRLEEEQLSMLKNFKLPSPPPSSSSESQQGDEEEDSLLSGLPSLPTSSQYSKTFYEGDMREEIKKIRDKSVHLVLTDPPYGMGVKSFDDGGNATLRHEYGEEDFRELHRVLLDEMQRVCTDNAHAYIFCDIDYFHELRDNLRDLDWWVRRRPVIWSKGSGKMADGTPQGFSSSYECILFAKRGSRPCRGLMPDVIRLANERGRVHAAQKPRELYDKLIKHSTIPGDTVLDAFAGSGTIFRTQEPVNVIGIEASEKFAGYCRLAMEGKQVQGDVGEDE